MIIIKGNGKPELKKYNISSFLNLHLSVNGLIELHHSDEEKVEIETDENLLDYLSVMNSGKTLFVASESGIRKPAFTNLTVRVFFRQISKLNIRCDGGKVICVNDISQTSPLEVKIQSIGDTVLKIDLPILKILIQNEGDVTLTGKCLEADIKTQSEGNLFAKELIAEKLKLKNMSDGNVEVSASKIISITHYGEGFVHYYGDARLDDVSHYGVGQVKHMSHEAIN